MPLVDFSEDNLQLEHQLLIGESKPMLKLKETIKKVARSQAPVFISGESGTGKEVVAHLIHKLSNRSDSAFVAINCGAISEELIERELFGSVSATSAGTTPDKLGLIQSANGGCLFLDEIAELSLTTQTKLLRALQEKKIRPLGSDQEVDVDFRIISATNQNLEERVQQGKFRQDLFFRIHVMDLHLPPLRERGKDILILAHHFIKNICLEWDIPSKVLNEDAKRFLQVQPFAGNVRELRNMIERAITLCDEHVIGIEHLQYSQKRNFNVEKTEEQINIEPRLATQPISNNIPSEGLEQFLENVEKEVLLNALNQTHWNRTLAAKKLGMTFRSLRYRLKKFGLDSEED